jgi:hypothetical protein
MTNIKRGDRVRVTYEGTAQHPSAQGDDWTVKREDGITVWVQTESITVLRPPFPDEVGTVLYDRTADVTWVLIGNPWQKKPAWINVQTGTISGEDYLPGAWEDGLVELKTTL